MTTAATDATEDLRPLTLIRRVVARRMAEAARTIPSVTIHRPADFGALLAYRRRVPGVSRPGIDALLAVLSAQSLATHDLLNGAWVDDPPAVRVHPARHVAVAVDTAHGLTAVVLRDADRRPIDDVTSAHRVMVGRAHAGRSTADDVSGATFTISNLGAFGVSTFTPLITPPQAAVLGIGAIALDAQGRQSAMLSLTFDHRIADGVYAARFLGDLAERIGAAAFEGEGRDG